MKFYEVQEQWNNLHWNTVAFFRKKADAEKCLEICNSRRVSWPVRTVEKKFSKIKDFE